MVLPQIVLIAFGFNGKAYAPKVGVHLPQGAVGVDGAGTFADRDATPNTVQSLFCEAILGNRSKYLGFSRRIKYNEKH